MFPSMSRTRGRRITKTARVTSHGRHLSKNSTDYFPSSTILRTGYLYKRVSSNNNIHKQYFFVLTKETLTYFRKKNDNRAKGEIYLPCRVKDSVGHKSKNAFEIIPLKLEDHHSHEFHERREESIIVIAEDTAEKQAWIASIEQMSRDIMEPFIFPDAIINDDDEEEAANERLKNVFYDKSEYNEIEKCVHKTMSAMLDKNYFGFSETSNSKWRTALSLRGLNSEDMILDDSLIIGQMAPQQHMQASNSLCIHNTHNLMAMGSMDNLQVFALNVSKGKCMEGTDMDEEEHDLGMIYELNLKHGRIISIDWRDDVLIVGTDNGHSIAYRTKISMNENGFNLELGKNEVFSLSEKQQNSAAMISAPGSWMHSLRTTSVAISHKNDCFLSIENEWFHLWSLNGNNLHPVMSEKASSGPLFCVEWNPHQWHQFMIAGVSGNLKLIDTRELSHNNCGRSVPWRVKNAHHNSIRDISWSTLCEYWIATCADDGCVKIWDERYPASAVRTLQAHKNAVKCVDWSRSHCELLVSGSEDRTLNLWNIRQECEPHHLLYSHTFGSSVIGCGFSNHRPLQMFGLSSIGELQSIEPTANFVSDFVVHRFSENDIRSRNIEHLLCMRDMKAVYKLIPEYAEYLWHNNKYAQAQELLNLISTIGFQSIIDRGKPYKNKSPLTFENMLRKLSIFYHSKCVTKSTPDSKDIQFCELMKLRMFVRKVLFKKEWNKLLLMEEKIFERLAAEVTYANNFFIEIIHLLKIHSYINSLQWSIRLLDLYQKQNKFHLFSSISISFLYPTIYHGTLHSTANDPSLIRTTQYLLDTLFNDHKHIRWQLKLLLLLHDSIQKTTDSSLNIIRIWDTYVIKDEPLSQVCYRLYFNALLKQGFLDTFFVECSKLVHKLKAYDFASVISELMDNVGYLQLDQYLKLQVSATVEDDNKEMDVCEQFRQCCDGLLTIVTICENCVQLADCLKTHLPLHLKIYSSSIQTLYNMRSTHQIKTRMMEYGVQLIQRIKKIQNSKNCPQFFFRNEIHNITTMINAFCQ